MKKSTAFIAILVAGLAVIGWLMLPPTKAGRDGQAAADAAGTREGQPIATVVPPESLSPEATIGKRAFEAKCAACHGENAAGREGFGPPLVHDYYKPSHHGDMAFVLAAQNGVRAHHWRFGDMPPQEGLTPADVAAITSYVRELQRANGIQ